MVKLKRKNVSGLTGVELTQALLDIQNVLAKAEADKKLLEESGEGGGLYELDDNEVSRLQEIYNMLDKRSQDPYSFSFSGMTDEALKRFGIKYAGGLAPKRTLLDTAVANADKIGENEHSSANGLFKHLELLERIVPQTNEAAARLWINAFFYRVAAILPSEHSLVLNVEWAVPPVAPTNLGLNAVSGYVDWTAMTTPSVDLASAFKLNPHISDLKDNASALFVTEAKSFGGALKDHVPQTVVEMCGCAHRTEKKTIRGALTNGHQWMFLIVKFNEAGEITYLLSDQLSILTGSYNEVSKHQIGIIVTILAHWMIHSHEDIRDDDHFVIQPIRGQLVKPLAIETESETR